MNNKYKNNLNQERIINYSNKDFYSICKTKKKLNIIKNLVNKEKKIVVFRKVIDLNTLKKINRIKDNILKRKPLFFKTFLGSKDLFIFNKVNKKSTVKGYFRKIELYPWNEKNKKIYSNLKNIMNLKCLMENANFNNSKTNNFFDDKKFWKIQLTNYPPKKGFLNKHVDGLYKNMILLQVGMLINSKITRNSGLIFYFDNEKIFFDQYIKPGDLALYNPMIPHSVKSQNSGRGRWSMLISSGYFSTSKGTKLQSKEIKL